MSIKVFVDVFSVGRAWPLPHGVSARQGVENVLDARSCLANLLHPLFGGLLKIERRRIDLGVVSLFRDMQGIAIAAARAQSDDFAVS
jgi:hypothetical protein